MPSDALHLYALARELDKKLSAGRIDRVNMPDGESVVLSVRAQNENHRLILSANPTHPRIGLTRIDYKNPAVAPSFCMHLRKFLTGAQIQNIAAPKYERVVTVSVLAKNELGDATPMTLVAELMGRCSNILLVGNDGYIGECIKHIPLDLSGGRQLLPNLKYIPVPMQEDRLTLNDRDAVIERLTAFTGGAIADFVLQTVVGLAPFTVKQAALSALSKLEAESLTRADAEKLVDTLCGYYRAVDSANYTPVLIANAAGAPADFAAIPFDGKNVSVFPSLTDASAEYFDSLERTRLWTQALSAPAAAVKSALNKSKKRIATYRAKLVECKDMDTLRLYGELLTSNLYAFSDSKKGAALSSVTLDNYYTGEKIDIPLDTSKSVKDNAKAFFKKYAKLKRALTTTQNLLEESEKTADYIESVKASLELCTTLDDIEEVKQELSSAGLLAVQNGKKKILPQSLPLVEELGGYKIFVGKNNNQNDRLTFKTANSMDMWLHVLGTHGSHVVIQNPTKGEIPDHVLRRAAELAAYYSQARLSGKTPVDYTYKKYVTKPVGAALGRVIYTNQKTVNIEPKK